jgi:hypothetical protein
MSVRIGWPAVVRQTGQIAGRRGQSLPDSACYAGVHMRDVEWTRMDV